MDFFTYITNCNMLKNIIICRDFSAHSLLWGDQPTNKAGKLIETLITNNTELAIATPLKSKYIFYHSSTDAFILLTNVINEFLSKNNVLITVFLDFEGVINI